MMEKNFSRVSETVLCVHLYDWILHENEQLVKFLKVAGVEITAALVIKDSKVKDCACVRWRSKADAVFVVGSGISL